MFRRPAEPQEVIYPLKPSTVFPQAHLRLDHQLDQPDETPHPFSIGRMCLGEVVTFGQELVRQITPIATTSLQAIVGWDRDVLAFDALRDLLARPASVPATLLKWYAGAATILYGALSTDQAV
ncbi:hypothetical protein [Deinococcus navajonensis]|uniref:Cytochrome P450 n=1 Tax=Deinococcus navajonensis TaxID=309884 RepID=A0ABV8XI44_9DEIO